MDSKAEFEPAPIEHTDPFAPPPPFSLVDEDLPSSLHLLSSLTTPYGTEISPDIPPPPLPMDPIPSSAARVAARTFDRGKFNADAYSFSMPDNSNSFQARVQLRSLIAGVITAEYYDIDESVETLEDAMEQSRRVGVPFSSLLQEPMDGVGVTPLTYEILRCDWKNAPELLEFLIFHTARGSTDSNADVTWVTRKACLQRGNDGNELLQFLKPLIAAAKASVDAGFLVDPEVFVSETSPVYEYAPAAESSSTPATVCHFTALSSVPDFSVTLKNVEAEFALPPGKSTLEPLPQREPTIPFEFIAHRHAWRLEIGSNSLKLTLLEGPHNGNVSTMWVDARLRIVNTLPGTGEFLFARKELAPVSHSGTSSVRIFPCFAPPSDDSKEKEAMLQPRSFDDDIFLLDRSLSFELDVKLTIKSDPTKASSSKAGECANADEDCDDELNADKPTSGAGKAQSQTGPSEDEWDDLYVTDNTNVESDAGGSDAGWVKANYSGRDEDL